MPTRTIRTWAGASIVGVLVAMTPPVHAANCTTGAKAAAQLWNEYGKVVKPLGCAAGAAGATLLSGGVALPASAGMFASCLKTANTADQATKGMIKAWNDLNKNGWGTIGDRDLRMGNAYKGAVPSIGTRMWITSAPITDPFVRVRVTKREGGWNNAASTQLTVCAFPPSGPGVDQSGEKLWSYEFASGKKNQGKTVERVFAIPGNILTVAFKGESAAKNFKYRLELEPVGNVDHDVVITGEETSGATNYEIETSGGLAPVQGNFLKGYKASINDGDRIRPYKAWGRVGGGTDAFVVAGKIERLELENEDAARVYVDGEPWRDNGPAADSSTVSLEYGYNRGGSDYRNFALDRPNPGICQQSCAEEARCRAFTFVPPGRQGPKARCWLKDAVPKRTPKDGLVSGVKGSRPIHNVSIERDYNRGGSDYRSFDLNRPNPRLCRQACAKEARCDSYTYVPPGRQGPDARCWLKDGVPQRKAKNGLVSGVKQDG